MGIYRENDFEVILRSKRITISVWKEQFHDLLIYRDVDESETKLQKVF